MDIVRLGAELLETLQGKGWGIERSASSEPLLPPLVQQRYPRVPVAVTGFLETLESCVNPEETVWFLCREDYRRTDDQAFRWNEFELMDLEEADGETAREIRGFWDRHFPFMLAVHSDYNYLAVSLDDSSYGYIVHGSGPDFEETSVVAPSFADFLTLLREEALGIRTAYPLSYFL